MQACTAVVLHLDSSRVKAGAGQESADRARGKLSGALVVLLDDFDRCSRRNVTPDIWGVGRAAVCYDKAVVLQYIVGCISAYICMYEVLRII